MSRRLVLCKPKWSFPFRPETTVRTEQSSPAAATVVGHQLAAERWAEAVWPRSLGPICRQLSNLSERSARVWADAGRRWSVFVRAPVGGTSSRQNVEIVVWSGRVVYIRRHASTTADDRSQPTSGNVPGTRRPSNSPAAGALRKKSLAGTSPLFWMSSSKRCRQASVV